MQRVKEVRGGLVCKGLKRSSVQGVKEVRGGLVLGCKGSIF